MKRCKSCDVTKHTNDFYSGRARCKDCVRDRMNTWRKGKENDLAIKQKRHRRVYNISWRRWFRSHYGRNPTCEICGKILSFRENRSTGNAVFFDHRRGGSEPISINPASFYTKRPCSPDNRLIWIQSGFGILCQVCNLGLPTKNRTEWLLAALNYDRKKEVE